MHKKIEILKRLQISQIRSFHELFDKYRLFAQQTIYIYQKCHEMNSLGTYNILNVE
jgi:hypothetical protein